MIVPSDANGDIKAWINRFVCSRLNLVLTTKVLVEGKCLVDHINEFPLMLGVT